jgi:hypothetical protein
MDDPDMSSVHHPFGGHPSKAEKRVSIAYSERCNMTCIFKKFYNFLKFNTTSQKAHGTRKKA